jgi:hypothetical protein
MRRQAFNIAAMASLLLCVGTLALWTRSYRSHIGGPDSFDLTHSDPLYWFVSNPGHATFCRQVGKTWGSPVGRVVFLDFEIASSPPARDTLINVLVPYWMIAVAAILPPLAWIRWRWRRSRHASPGHCPQCGYDLRATVERCPECGRPVTTETKA